MTAPAPRPEPRRRTAVPARGRPGGREATATRVTATIAAGPDQHTPWGVVHGGVYTTAVESACSIGASLAVLDRGEYAVGLSNHTDFLRPHVEGELRVTATPVQQGRTQQLWQCDIARARRQARRARPAAAAERAARGAKPGDAAGSVRRRVGEHERAGDRRAGRGVEVVGQRTARRRPPRPRSPPPTRHHRRHPPRDAARRGRRARRARATTSRLPEALHRDEDRERERARRAPRRRERRARRARGALRAVEADDEQASVQQRERAEHERGQRRRRARGRASLDAEHVAEQQLLQPRPACRATARAARRARAAP